MASGATAVVLPFPIQEARSCFICEHWRGIEGGSVSWCSAYEQVIDSEAYEAGDCFIYERTDEGSQPILDEDPRGEA